MSDIPLTEKRCLELLQINNEHIIKRIDRIENKIMNLEKTMIKRFNRLDKKLEKLQRYQDNESKAIEYEFHGPCDFVKIS